MPVVRYKHVTDSQLAALLKRVKMKKHGMRCVSFDVTEHTSDGNDTKRVVKKRPGGGIYTDQARILYGERFNDVTIHYEVERRIKNDR